MAFTIKNWVTKQQEQRAAWAHSVRVRKIGSNQKSAVAQENAVGRGKMLGLEVRKNCAGHFVLGNKQRSEHRHQLKIFRNDSARRRSRGQWRAGFRGR